MMKKLLSLALISFAFWSCQKSEDYVPVPYACECGQLSWDGEVYQLLDANYLQYDSLEALSRRYYVTANVALEGEDLDHSVSFILEIPNVEDVNFFLDEDDAEFVGIIYERNENDPLLNERQYVPIEGVVQVNPAILGGTETVTFNLVINELNDGSPVGFDIPFTGSFKVDVDL